MKSLLILALCLGTCVQAADLRGRVVAVSYGDTVTDLDTERHQYKVRLAGIDAPSNFNISSPPRLRTTSLL